MSSIATPPETGSTLSGDNPFPGLRPYQEEDAAWFFGRANEINTLLKRFRRNRFVAVLGPSGCGKSSLIRAGLLPAIRDGYLDAPWKISVFRPGECPLENLTAAVIDFAESWDPTAIKSALAAGPMGLVEVILELQRHQPANYMILVDQFEELFQFVQRRGDQAQEEAKAFLKLFLATIALDGLPLYLVVTMRLEWLNECTTYVGLAEAINDGIYLVPQMSRRQFQQSIVAPVEAANGKVTMALVDRMLNDLDARTDQLPILQHALMRMWQNLKPGDTLNMSMYETVGTLSDCLSNHAEEIYGQLDDVQKVVGEALFRSITEVNKNRRIRRPMSLGDIATSTGVPIDQLEVVAKAFESRGRSFLVTTPGKLPSESLVDISHEALIRQWSRLGAWVDSEARITRAKNGLRETAERWAEKRKDSGFLYRGRQLADVEDILRPRISSLGALESDFLRASRRRRLWERARDLFLVAGVIATAIVIPSYYSVKVSRLNALLKASIDRQNAPQADKARTALEEAAQDPARSEITIQYFASGANAASKPMSRWRNLNFQTDIRTPDSELPVNSLWYGREVDLLSVQLVAYSLIETGVAIRQISPLSETSLDKVIQVKWISGIEGNSPQTVEKIQKLVPIRPQNAFVTQIRPGTKPLNGPQHSAAPPVAQNGTGPRIVAGITPAPSHDLTYHGGKTMAKLTYINIYLGSDNAWKSSDITSIDRALVEALSDESLNRVIAQYFPGQIVRSSFGGSFRSPMDQNPAVMSQGDVEAFVRDSVSREELKGIDTKSTVLNILLPSGTVLNDDPKPSQPGFAPSGANSHMGLGGYHGSIHTGPESSGWPIYYAVNVSSEIGHDGKENGIPVFDQAWKNVVATAYHELNGIRTDSDVEDAIRAGTDPNAIKFLGWTSKQGEEIGMFPVFAAGNNLSLVFREVPLTNGHGAVPVQLLYSNAVHGPEEPRRLDEHKH